MPAVPSSLSSPRPPKKRGIKKNGIKKKRFMANTKKKLQIFFEDTHSSWLAHLTSSFLTLMDISGVLIVGLETLDGPNWEGSHPEFPDLPSLETYIIFDRFINGIFIAELLCRLMISDSIFKPSKKSFRTPFFRDPLNWCDMLAIIPFLVTEFYLLSNNSNVRTVRRDLNAARTFRVFKLIRRFKGADVLVEAIKKSAIPLLLPIFVLSVFVFINSGIIFLLEPCVSVEDDSLCQFTDILNVAYFCIVTMTTTGFGDQKPQTAITRAITVVIMISGSLFLAMPLSIVGNNFDLVWSFKEKLKDRHNKKTKTFLDLKQKTITINENTMILQDRCVVLLSEMGGIESYFQVLWKEGKLNLHAATKLRWAFNDFKDDFNRFILHLRDVVEALTDSELTSQGLVKLEEDGVRYRNQKKKQHIENYNLDASNVKVVRQLEAVHSDRLTKFKKSIMKERKIESLEKFLNDPDSSVFANLYKFFMMAVILLSIIVFCLETMPEIQQLGEDSYQCQKVVELYCQNKDSIDMDPGCFVQSTSSNDNPDKIKFFCDDNDCYGNNGNFGSTDSDLNCAATPLPFQSQDTLTIGGGFFRIQGAKQSNQDYAICSRPECVKNNPYTNAISWWFPLETFFACCFVFEILLRIISVGNPIVYLGELMNWFDVLSTLPYFFEVIGAKDSTALRYAFIYSTTDDAFFAVFKFFKIARIFKIMRHYDGIRVINNTFKRCKDKLAVPLFFLFVMIFTFSLMLLPLENGTECFVGENVCKNSVGTDLREEFAVIVEENRYAEGKRILIDVDGNEVMIPDVMSSIWLLIATMTTVGYGDIFPITEAGKFFMVGIMLIGIFYMTMPLSIVSAIFNEEYEKAHDPPRKPELDSILVAALSGTNETKQHIRRLELLINRDERIRSNPEGWTKVDEDEFNELQIIPQVEIMKLLSWMMKIARLLQVLEVNMKVTTGKKNEKEEERLEQLFLNARVGKLNNSKKVTLKKNKTNKLSSPKQTKMNPAGGV